MNKRLLIVFLFTSSIFVRGQEMSWSLQKCFDVALNNNIDIKIQQLEILRSKKNYTHPLLELVPSVGLSANHSYNFGSTIDPNTNSRVSSDIQWDNVNLNASINVLDFSNLSTARKNKLEVELSKADKEVIEYEYKLQLLEKYFEVLYSQEQLKIQKEQFKNAVYNLERIQKEVEIGSKPKSDLYDMQLSFAQEEMRILQTEQLFLVQKKQLFQLMNVENPAIAEVVLEPFLDKNAAENSVENNPKIRAAELGYQSSLKDTKLERANNLPTLTTFYGFSTFYYKPLNQPDIIVDNFNKQISDNKNHQLGLQLNVPIFNGFRNSKRVSATKIEVEKSKLIIEQEKLKVKNQIDIETQNKVNFEQLEKKLEEMKTYADASFRTSQSKYTSGVIDAIVFSAVKNQLLSAEYDLLKNQLQIQFTDIKINLIQGKVL